MVTFGAYGIQEIKKRLETWSIAYKKRWGQNFLLDRNICDKIVRNGLKLVDSSKNPHPLCIWEIGPGLGALSDMLHQHNSEGSLVLFEIDYGVIRMLTQYIEEAELSSQISIISGDAEESMITYIKEIAQQYKSNARKEIFPALITGNLPYSSGVRLLLTVSQLSSFIKAICDIEYAYVPMHVMLQKEVAERLTATPSNKQYGMSTVLLQIIYDIRIDFEVVATSFYPVPHVDSVVCSFTPKTDVPIYTLEELHTLKKIVRVSFLQRRKTLRNTLGAFFKSQHIDDYEQLCAKHGIAMGARAETISPQQFMALACELVKRNDSVV